MQNLSLKNKKIHTLKEKRNKDSINISTLIKEELKKLNKFIIENIKSEVPLIPLLSEHLLEAGGKRIRPTLTILCSKLFGYNYGNRHISLAACIEFIHMASLLHDDVVDESSMRRGKKTANRIWGNKASVLVGDYLFSKAFQIMVNDNDPLVLKALSDASRSLAQGEVMQLSLVNNIDVNKEKYFKVIEDKTAKLFSAAAFIGGVVSREKLDNLNNLSSYGKYIGTSFQILDDVMDYDTSKKNTGKKIGNDFKEGKVTLPILLAISRSNKKEKQFWKRVIEKLEQDENDFEEAIHILIKYDCLNDARQTAKSYADKANKLTSFFPNNIFNDALVELSSFVFERNN